MPTARRSAAAERDLQDIAYHIALEDGRPLTADRVINTLIGQAEEIARPSFIQLWVRGRRGGSIGLSVS